MTAKMLREDWEFNVLQVYNYRKPGPLQYYFDYVMENCDRIPGDLVEAGVFRGRSLIGMALLLKELGSSKMLYGYDTWSGFPQICHDKDDYSQWKRLREDGRISEEHLLKLRLNREYRRFGLSSRKTDTMGWIGVDVSPVHCRL